MRDDPLDEWIDAEYTAEGLIIDGALHPFCSVEGCEFCACSWGHRSKCYRHGLEEFGKEKMERLYFESHGYTWEESQED